MWYKHDGKNDWSDAIRHLSRDKRLKAIIKKVGPCTLRPRRDYFPMLVLAIFNQQISMKVAEVLYARFVNQMPRKRVTPANVLAYLNSHPADEVKTLGISRQKRAYLLDLAEHFVAGKIPTRKFRTMSDQQIIDCLTQVKGIGQWTAEMFLMFNLNRPDVFPIGDLGLQKNFMRLCGFKELPHRDHIIAHSKPWQPWRTIATWYLWRSGE